MTTTTTSTIREQIEERREVPLSQLRERYAGIFGELMTSGPASGSSYRIP
jgi:hypothetical protein